jgi:hypothetical protein
MWPLPKIRNEYITVSLSPTQIICAWLGPHDPYPLMLKAYHAASIDAPTATIIEDHLHQFIKTHQLSHAFLRIALATPHLHEQLMRMACATPTIQELSTSDLKKMMWDYRYLHPLDDNQYLFYVCGIAQPTLFMHQLIAHKTNLHLATLTSSYMALLQSYRTLFGPAFRQSGLAIDMIRHNYKLENSISLDSIARLVRIPPALSIDLHTQKLNVLTMIGLYYQERVYNAAY